MTIQHRWWIAFALMLMLPAAALSAQCTATSGARRVAMLELYTSEGCDSCPPTDRWVSALPSRGLPAERLLTLAFHVDYWNYLGWDDPFAQARFSERQRLASARNKTRFVYTPQLMLNGRDYRRGVVRDDFAEKITTINSDKPHAAITLMHAPPLNGSLAVSASITLDGVAQRSLAQTYLALYENNLANQVSAGENRGKKLHHDFVVRELAGPFAADASGSLNITHSFKLARNWKSHDLHIAVFVQDQRSGEVLQALAAARCN
jgi:hypothetical protein